MPQGDPSRGPSTGSAQASKNKPGDPIEAMAGAATEKLRDVADKAEKMVSDAAQHGREAGENVQNVADNFKGAVEKSLKDQPMTTLAAAALVGFLVGALWKS